MYIVNNNKLFSKTALKCQSIENNANAKHFDSRLHRLHGVLCVFRGKITEQVKPNQCATMEIDSYIASKSRNAKRERERASQNDESNIK